MFRVTRFCIAAALPVLAIGAANLQADHRAATFAVIMTNDSSGPASNEIKVYDAGTKALVQTISTHGKGGVGGNARGVRQYNGKLVAVVNNGSTRSPSQRHRTSVRQAGDDDQRTGSVDFGNDHMAWLGPRLSIHSCCMATAWDGSMARS